MKHPHEREDLDTLWARYAETRDEDAREQLILNYSPLVKFVAGRVGTRLPNTIENADLISYGIFGLIDAIEKYEPERGFKFETYAIARIRGAIIDELRALDWVPRSVRARARDIENAIVALEARLNRTPEDDEVANELGISQNELQDSYNKLARSSVVSFDEVWSPNADRDDKSTLASVIKDDSAPDPVAAFETIEVRQSLAEAVEQLSERERTVVALYYYQGLQLKEIGQVLGVTESRASQLHTKAVLHLRAHLHSTQTFVS